MPSASFATQGYPAPRYSLPPDVGAMMSFAGTPSVPYTPLMNSGITGGSGFNWSTLAGMLPGVGSILGPVLGSIFGGEPEVQAMDTLNRRTISWAPETGAESMLAGKQQALSGRAMTQAYAPLPQVFGWNNIQGMMTQAQSGVLSPETQRRMDAMAYSGLNRAGQQAGLAAAERSVSMGTPGSSAQGLYAQGMVQPMASEMARYRAQLEMQELQRQMEMARYYQQVQDQHLANMMAVQNSPALTRLMQIRAGQQTGTDTLMRREGGGLPAWAYA
jgi:hypothetical protein